MNLLQKLQRFFYLFSTNNSRGFIPLLLVAAIAVAAVAIPATVTLVQQQQDIRQSAALSIGQEVCATTANYYKCDDNVILVKSQRTKDEVSRVSCEAGTICQISNPTAQCVTCVDPFSKLPSTPTPTPAPRNYSCGQDILPNNITETCRISCIGSEQGDSSKTCPNTTAEGVEVPQQCCVARTQATAPTNTPTPSSGQIGRQSTPTIATDNTGRNLGQGNPNLTPIVDGRQPGQEGGTNPTTAPPASGRCASRGGLDTAKYGPKGYAGPTCDHKFFSQENPQAAKPGRLYADAYGCADGSFEYAEYPNLDTCDKYPWIDNTTPTTPNTCKVPGTNNQTTCDDPDTECALDFESTTEYSCVQKGFKWCEIQGKEIISTGECRGTVGIGQTCGADTQCSNYPDAVCKDFGNTGFKTCQWASGSSPTPTPGAAGNCQLGFMGTGCECTNIGGGCKSSHVCYPADDNSSRKYCVPFGTGERWCEQSQTSVPRNTCSQQPVFNTPTPTIDPITGSCPNDGNHVCAQNGQCVNGYGPKGDDAADQRCTNWNGGYPSECYFKGAPPAASCSTQQATPTRAPSAPTSTPQPTPPGCPIDNGDGKVNNCQASCQSPYPNPKPDGHDECQAAYPGQNRNFCCQTN